MRFFHPSLAVCLALVLATGMLAAHAQAQDAHYLQVQRLMNAGQNAEALKAADAWLLDKPRDPQMRFLKGVIQNQQGHAELAQATFTALTQDYPELPEPHNNLAVLYANAQRYDEARTELEMAVRLNPLYARAHQNLGDVHAKLAAQSYARALELDNGNLSARERSQTLNQMLSRQAPAR